MNPFLQQLICCPDCRGELSASAPYSIGTGSGGHDASACRDRPLGLSNKDRSKDLSLHCEGCQASFPVEEGVPLLFSKGIQQETTYKTYSEQYQEHELSLHERDSRIVAYLNMNSLERVKYHLLHGPSSLRLRKSARKEAKRFVSLAQFVGPTEGLTILDVGAREGLFLGLLKGNKVAFDLSPFHLKFSREQGSSGVAGFGERLPFKDNSFDVVVCSQVLEHVLNPEVIAGEMVRVLKPTGRVIVETPFGEAEENLFEVQGDSGQMVRRGDPAGRPYHRKGRPPTFHVRSFRDEKELERLFPSLKAGKKEFCFYKRRKDISRWVKGLLGPFRRLPDSLKIPFPALFAPTIVRMEFAPKEQ
ncbi:MAG TPA: methyltransferase domain-containing protein [Candidatus Tripitaka sp. YC43]